MQFKGAILGLSLLLTAPAALAGPYVGAGLNVISYNDSVYEDTAGLELAGGYSFNKYIAIEAAYMDWGEADDDTYPIWTLSGNSLKAAVKGIFPVNDMFSLIGKIGVHSWDLEVKDSSDRLQGDNDGSDSFFALGAEFNINKHFAISASAARYNVDKGDFNSVGALALYRF